MKRALLLMVFTLLFGGCTKNIKQTSQTSIEEMSHYDYDVIKEKIINWNDLFSVEKDHYNAYIYSKTCVHCNEIKQDIISYGLNHDDFYFIEYNKSIPVSESVDATIGKSNVEEISILGTPTLLTIENGILIKNIAGGKAILEAI